MSPFPSSPDRAHALHAAIEGTATTPVCPRRYRGDRSGCWRTIDFIDQPHGFRAKDVSRTDHALKQHRASVVCAREFTRDMLASDRTRVALKLNERIFKFWLDDRDGCEVHVKLDVDPFEGVVSDEKHLTARFRERRHPQIRPDLEARPKPRRR